MKYLVYSNDNQAWGEGVRVYLFDTEREAIAHAEESVKDNPENNVYICKVMLVSLAKDRQ